MRLYLDDERPTPPGWRHVRWPDEAIDLVAQGLVERISLDHDLGDDDRGTGYDVVLWIEERVAHGLLAPPAIQVHSANTSAREKMQRGVQAIDRFITRQGPPKAVLRPVRPEDLDGWVALRHALWPGAPRQDARLESHTRDALDFFARLWPLPSQVFVLEAQGGELVGLAEVSERPWVEGMDSRRVGYLEGWFVTPAMRRQGWGGALVRAALGWARQRACTAFASDTDADNAASLAAHRALGFRPLDGPIQILERPF